MSFRRVFLPILVLIGCNKTPDDTGTMPTPASQLFEALATPLAIQHLPLDALQGTGLALGDMDGDGHLDFVVAPGWGPVLRFQGKVDGWQPWPGDPVWPSSSAPLLHDLDEDGDPDLLLPLEEGFAVYRNDDGQLTDATEASGLGALTTTGVVHLLAVDLDADGFIDVYASSQNGPNPVLWGRGDLTFDPDPASALAGDEATWSATWLDLTGDGHPDLYTTTDTLALDYGQEPESNTPSQEPEHDRLYAWVNTNDERADYSEVSRTMGFAARRSSMGAVPLPTAGATLPSLFISDFGRNDLMVPDGAAYSPNTEAAGLAFPYHNTGVCADQEGDLRPCLLVSWAALEADWSGDGVGDLLVFNGGIEPDEVGLQPAEFYDLGDGTAHETGQPPANARSAVLVPGVAGGPPDVLWTAYMGGSHRWRSLAQGPHTPLRLHSTQSAPDGAGAIVVSPNGTRHWVGAGGVAMVDPAPLVYVPGEGPFTVIWPSGRIQVDVLPDNGIIEEPEQVVLSVRSAPADTVSEVIVTLRNAMVSNASATASGPAIASAPAQVGDDVQWTLTSSAAGNSRVYLTVGGDTLRYAPRIWWTDPENP